VLATVRTWVSLRTLQEQTIIGSPLAQIPMSASSLKADIHHDDGDVRFVPIVLQKSFLADERNFSGPLMRFVRDDVRDHIILYKSDHGPSYRP
jgi:hypothetical protein